VAVIAGCRFHGCNPGIRCAVLDTHPKIFWASIHFVIHTNPPTKRFGGVELKMLRRKHWRDDIGRPGQFTLAAEWATLSCISTVRVRIEQHNLQCIQNIFSSKKRILNGLEDILFDTRWVYQNTTLSTAARVAQRRTISLSQSEKKPMRNGRYIRNTNLVCSRQAKNYFYSDIVSTQTLIQVSQNTFAGLS